MYKKVEIVTNIVIIAVGLLLGVVLVKNLLHDSSHRSRQASIKEVEAGEKLSLPDVDWEKNGATLLLVLSLRCRFCTESAPFYQRLARETNQSNRPKLIAVFQPSDRDAKKYLGELGVAIDDVRNADLDSLNVAGTPCLILADKAGVVTGVWRGRLSSDEEEAVLSSVREDCDCR
jgi:hypothetical protein